MARTGSGSNDSTGVRPGPCRRATSSRRSKVSRRSWLEVQDAREAFLATLTTEKLAGPLSYAGFDGKGFTRVLSDALFHVANHGTYHRGQVATLLRQLGKSPVSTDFTRWLNERTPG